MVTLSLNRGLKYLVKNDIKSLYFVKFILYGKIDIKYEISISKLPNLSLITLKIEKMVKNWTLTLTLSFATF